MRLRPGVAEWVHLPGIPVRDGAESYNSEQLASWLRHLGVSAGARKAERVDALEEALRDINVVKRAIHNLEPEARDLFERVARKGHARISDVDPMGIYGRNTPFHQLHASGLVGARMYENVLWVWLDVIVALTGGLYYDWSVERPVPRSLTDPGPEQIPPVVGRVDQLLDRWSASPPRALKSGGLGVKQVRSAAKGLGVTSSEVGLLAALAIELGLLAPVVTATRGRGRNASFDEEWRPTERRSEWSSDPAWRRWATLVQEWLDSQQLDVAGKAIERHESDAPLLNRPLTRRSYLEALASLGVGFGLEKADLDAWLAFRMPSVMAPAVVEQLTDEAQALGLVTKQGPIGLTSIAHRLLEGLDQLAAATAGTADQFTLQGDHTVIAPPDLHPDVAGDLERLSRLESDAGARIYRVDGESLIRAFDDGWTPERVLAFLGEHSTTPVPQNVERTVRDAAERHGRLLIGSATTWVTSDDPSALAEAVAVKAAHLESISPGLAVSSLAPEKVAEALRRKGLAPKEQTAEKPPAPVRRRRSPDTRELRERPLRSREELSRLAASVGVTTTAAAEPDASLELDWEDELLRLLEGDR